MPDSAAFLCLHQENLVASLDAVYPNAAQTRYSLQPAIVMPIVNIKLIETFQRFEPYSKAPHKAVDDLFEEGRRQKKTAEGEPSAEATDAETSSKRLRTPSVD